MRISDWSSDVCSSDLGPSGEHPDRIFDQFLEDLHQAGAVRAVDGAVVETAGGGHDGRDLERVVDDEGPLFARADGQDQDRKSVVSGKSVSVRVELGGPRIIKQKRQETVNTKSR